MSEYPKFGAGLWHFASYLDRYATDGYAPPVSTLEQIARAGAVGDLSVVDVPYPFTEGVTVEQVKEALRRTTSRRSVSRPRSTCASTRRVRSRTRTRLSGPMRSRS